MQKTSGWKRDLWRFLYKNRGSDRGVTVLEQDRAALVGIAAMRPAREPAAMRRGRRQYPAPLSPAAEQQLAALTRQAAAAQ